MEATLIILGYWLFAYCIFHFANWFFFKNIRILLEPKEVELSPAVAAGSAANEGAPAQPNRLLSGEGYDN